MCSIVLKDGIALMITNADRLRAAKLGKSLEDYFLDNLDEWETALSAISNAQSYTISNGQSSSRTVTHANLKEVESQVNKLTEKIENLIDSSTLSPKFRTIFTRRLNA